MATYYVFVQLDHISLFLLGQIRPVSQSKPSEIVVAVILDDGSRSCHVISSVKALKVSSVLNWVHPTMLSQIRNPDIHPSIYVYLHQVKSYNVSKTEKPDRKVNE